MHTGSPCDPKLCYISSLGTCFLPEINGPFARCNTTANLLVAGKRITVSLYEMRFGRGIGKCIGHYTKKHDY